MSGLALLCFNVTFFVVSSFGWALMYQGSLFKVLGILEGFRALVFKVLGWS